MSAVSLESRNGLPDAEACLQWEQQCFAEFTGKNGPQLILWQSAPAVVVSRSDQRLPRFADAAEQMAKRGWPVVLRRSGGTAVPQGPGMLNISWLTAPGEGPTGLRKDYDRFAQLLLRGLAFTGLDLSMGANAGSWCDGDFNLQCNGLKVGGTAQRRAGAKVMCQLAVAVDMPNRILVDAVNDFYERSGAEFRARLEASTDLHSEGVAKGLVVTSEYLVEGLISELKKQSPTLQWRSMGLAK